MESFDILKGCVPLKEKALLEVEIPDLAVF